MDMMAAIKYHAFGFIQATGCEVIHLGHKPDPSGNRPIVAMQEDVQAICDHVVSRWHA